MLPPVRKPMEFQLKILRKCQVFPAAMTAIALNRAVRLPKTTLPREPNKLLFKQRLTTAAQFIQRNFQSGASLAVSTDLVSN